MDLRLRLRKIPAGSVSEIRQDILFEEADFASAIIVEQDYDAYLSISLEARGQGKGQHRQSPPTLEPETVWKVCSRRQYPT